MYEVKNYKLDDAHQHQFVFENKYQLTVQTVTGTPSTVHAINLTDGVHERGYFLPYHKLFQSGKEYAITKEELANYVFQAHNYVKQHNVKDLQEANLETIALTLSPELSQN